MLDDFSKPSNAPQSRNHFATSLALSLAVCAAGGTAIVHATSEVKPMVFTEEPQAVPLPPELRPPRIEPVVVAIEPKKDRTPPKPPRVPTEVPKTILPESTAEVPPEVDQGEDEAPAVQVTLAPAPIPKQPGPISKPLDAGGNHYDRLKYPAAARRHGVSGVVVVRFDVLTDGSVANAKIVSGPAEFHAAVLDAASGWTFKPARQDGKAVVYRGLTKNVVFRLEDS